MQVAILVQGNGCISIILRELEVAEIRINMKKIMGYKREDGKFGLRNKVIIIPSVHCANKVCENIARKCNGAVYINHQHGCSQLDFDAL